MAVLPEATRLEFRRWTEADLPLAVALWGDPEVTRHFGGAMTPGEAEARMRLEMERERGFGVQYWPVFDKATGAHAGCAGLRPFEGDARVREVGVHIARSFWSGRYGEEAARAVIRFGFETLRLEALVAAHGPENVNSRALIGRLGFRYTHAAAWGRDGVLHPHYRLERGEYSEALSQGVR